MLNIPYSVWSGFFNDLTPEQAVDELSAAGFRYAELSLEHGIDMLAQRQRVAGNGVHAQLKILQRLVGAVGDLHRAKHGQAILLQCAVDHAEDIGKDFDFGTLQQLTVGVAEPDAFGSFRGKADAFLCGDAVLRGSARNGVFGGCNV